MRRFLKRKLPALTGLVIAASVMSFSGNIVAPTVAQADNALVHKSVIQLTNSDLADTTAKQIKIGLNKSVIVELPVSVRDVLVSNPKVVDAVVHTSKRAYLIGQSAGEANAFFFDQAGKRILTLEISVSRDMAVLENVLRRMFENSNIEIDTVDDRIILTGSVARPADAQRAVKVAMRFTDKAEKVINLLDVIGNEQVMLKVTIAEIERSVARQIGINLEKIAASGNIAVTSFRDMVFNYTSTLGGVASNMGVNWTSGSNTVSGTIKALEDNGIIKTLAEPNLTAISGETASFLAGGEFPIPVSEDDDGISVTFKKFGVGLAFTPLVMDRNRISLKIDTEISELSNRGAVTIGSIAIPGIKVRRANSTVEVPSGGSVVMAGLISDATKSGINDVPGLKKLPVLGALFRSRDFSRQETEMVVIVTPYLVKPANNPRKFLRPDHLVSVANSRDSFLKGHLNRRPMRSSWPVERHETVVPGLKDHSPVVTNSTRTKQPIRHKQPVVVKRKLIKKRAVRSKSAFGFIVE